MVSHAAAQQTYRISDSTQLTVNYKVVSLSGQNEQQVSVIGGDESHLSYSPIKVDEKLELLHKEFVTELTKLPETYVENDRSSRNTINRINSQLTGQSEYLQLLNSDICQLTADIAEKSEQLKTNLPELKFMELVTIKQLTL